MTIGTHYNCRVNHFVLSRYFPLSEEDFREINYFEYNRSVSRGEFIVHKKSYFQSQTTIKIRNVSIKIFDNGYISVVGCLSLSECKEILKLLTEKLEACRGDWKFPINFYDWAANFPINRKNIEDKRQKLEEQWNRGIRILDQCYIFPNPKPTKRERAKLLSLELQKGGLWLQQAILACSYFQITKTLPNLSWEAFMLGICEEGFVMKDCETSDVGWKFEEDKVCVFMINSFFQIAPFPKAQLIRDHILSTNVLRLYPNEKRGPAIIESDFIDGESNPLRVCFYCKSGKINLSANRSWENLQAAYDVICKWIAPIIERREEVKASLPPYNEVWLSEDESECWLYLNYSV
jgi:hypothetical protein